MDVPLSHRLVMAMRALGECRGRQVLYGEQFPEVLDTLRRVAVVQSTESSNRIEGILVAPERLEALVLKKTKPQDRSEQEVSGYRDVLSTIHAHPSKIQVSSHLILDWHRSLYRFTNERGGEWKLKDNAIIQIEPDGRRNVRFRPVSAAATPDYMERLVTLFDQALTDGKADPLLLIASFILDFECVHPFTDGNGRLGRLLTLVLLYHAGFDVGRYISLERIVEESKESYYEALFKSSQGWHEGQHDLRPWWNYFLGMLTAAYKEFEARVGSISSAKGAKREMVSSAIGRMPGHFSISDLQRACPGVSYPTLKRALEDLRKEKKVKCLGRGPQAKWQRI
ncbi:MAG: Fic family protein [Planctomycetota bacterium]